LGLQLIMYYRDNGIDDRSLLLRLRLISIRFSVFVSRSKSYWLGRRYVWLSVADDRLICRCSSSWITILWMIR
jgi:hypothetical protein